MDTCILILCGLPAAGKTTLAKTLTASTELSPDFHIVHLPYDDLMPDQVAAVLTEKPQTGKMEMTSWKKYREDIVSCVENIVKSWPEADMEFPPGVSVDLWTRIRHSFISHNRGDKQRHLLVIIDDNMYYQGMRYPFYQLARKYNIGFCQVYLESTIDMALRRNNERSVRIPEEVIHTMAAKFEPPTPAERHWEVHSLSIKQQSVGTIEAILGLVTVAIENKVAPLTDNVELQEMSRVKCSVSTLHQADQVLRKLVSEKMSNLDAGSVGKSKKEISCVYRQIRSKIYSELKLGSLLIPESIENVTDASKDRDSNLYRWLKEIYDSNCIDVKCK
ncbi:L-seryl-tRNA(Sec) kinase-like [Argonauta hians]